MASPRDGQSTDPDLPAISGKNGTPMRGLLAGNDPGNQQHAGAYGQSEQQGVMDMTSSPSGNGVFAMKADDLLKAFGAVDRQSGSLDRIRPGLIPVLVALDDRSRV